MKLHKLRLSFACNSSSVSSLILFNKDKDPKGQIEWKEIEEKRKFFAAVLYQQLIYQETDLSTEKETEINKYVSNLFDVSEIDSGFADTVYNYYTHTERGNGRRFSFPSKLDGSANEDFIKEFIKYLDDHDVSFASYEDNSFPEAYEIIEEHSSMGVNLLRYFPPGSVARKDGDYWTIVDKVNGTKMRLSLDYKTVSPTHSTIPELIDIKITDYCPMNCEYCYQGSTLEGRHANTSSLKKMIDNLAERGVLEVALGGGEPTLHPDFNHIVEYFHTRGIIVNVTTRNRKWFKEHLTTLLEENRNNWNDEALRGKVSAVALSIDTAEDVKEIRNIVTKCIDAYRKKSNRGPYRSEISLNKNIHLQYVVGVNDQLKNILEESRDYTLILLGYKNTHRGSLLKPRQDSWIDVVSDYYKEWYFDCRIGIDTVLAKDNLDKLVRAELQNLLLEKHEGKFSCYIDAVNQEIGPSSFCGRTEMFPYTEIKEDFKRITNS